MRGLPLESTHELTTSVVTVAVARDRGFAGFAAKAELPSSSAATAVIRAIRMESIATSWGVPRYASDAPSQ